MVLRPRQERGSPEPIKGKCGAKIRKTDPPRYCCKTPMKFRRRCRLHGGHSLRGLDSPKLKTGRKSKYAWLPPKMAEAVEKLEADATLLDLRPDIALLDALKQETGALLELGASVAAWRDAKRKARAVRTAIRESFPDGEAPKSVEDAVRELLQLLDGGSPMLARDELAKMIERKARLVQTCHDMQEKAQQLVPIEAIKLLLGGIALLVREHIPNESDRVEFSKRFTAYIGERLRPAVQPTADVGTGRLVGDGRGGSARESEGQDRD